VNGVKDVTTFVEYSMAYVGGFLGLLSICTLVYAGIRMITANGNDKTISESKSTIVYSLVGFALAVLAYAGVVAIENFIGVKTVTSSRNVIFNPFGPGATLESTVGNVLEKILTISGLISLFMIVLYGFRYMTARGDDKQVSTAKSGLTWSVVGLVLILFAYVIIRALATLLGK
jgi:heme A synthase